MNNSPVDTLLRIVHSDGTELVGKMNNSTNLEIYRANNVS